MLVFCWLGFTVRSFNAGPWAGIAHGAYNDTSIVKRKAENAFKKDQIIQHAKIMELSIQKQVGVVRLKVRENNSKISCKKNRISNPFSKIFFANDF